jgi:hypothetical protein
MRHVRSDRLASPEGQARGIVKHYTYLPAHTRLGSDGATRLPSLRLHDFVDQE